MVNFYDKIAGDVENFGQSLVAVAPDENGSHPFIYTVGNFERDLPELLIIGGTVVGFGWLLNKLGEMMRERAKPFDEGELVSVGGQFPVKVINACEEARTEYAIQVGRYYRTGQYAVQQVLICDKAGKYPDEAGCAEPYRDMPVLKIARH